jgi:tRNA modification GTPase
LGEERAIVNSLPGTTRDFIEESMQLDGLPVVLWDTAGIRQSDEEVEKIGVDYSLRRLEEAQGVLVVVDGSGPLAPEDHHVLEAVKQKEGLLVINKIDLPQELDVEEINVLTPEKEKVFVSAKQGNGLKELKLALRGLLLDAQNEPAIVVTNLRHKAALEIAEEKLQQASKALSAVLPPELVAVDLQEAKEVLGEIVGVIADDDILERIFSQFCIGK